MTSIQSMSTTHPTTLGISYESAPVSNAARIELVARLALVALLSALLVVAVVVTVAAVPALALPLLLFAWAGLLAVAVGGLVFAVQAAGESL